MHAWCSLRPCQRRRTSKQQYHTASAASLWSSGSWPRTNCSVEQTYNGSLHFQVRRRSCILPSRICSQLAGHKSFSSKSTASLSSRWALPWLEGRYRSTAVASDETCIYACMYVCMYILLGLIITHYCRLWMKWRSRNGFQRFWAPVYYWSPKPKKRKSLQPVLCSMALENCHKHLKQYWNSCFHKQQKCVPKSTVLFVFQFWGLNGHEICFSTNNA